MFRCKRIRESFNLGAIISACVVIFGFFAIHGFLRF